MSKSILAIVGDVASVLKKTIKTLKKKNLNFLDQINQTYQSGGSKFKNGD